MSASPISEEHYNTIYLRRYEKAADVDTADKLKKTIGDKDGLLFCENQVSAKNGFKNTDRSEAKFGIRQIGA